MATCYLRFSNDYLDDAQRCSSKKEAIAEFRAVAEELARYDQVIEGAIHYAKSKSELDEYPDFVLSLGPRGGVAVSGT